MSGTKQSVYFALKTWEEIRAEAKRLNRTVSWVLLYAWRHGRKEVAKLQTVINDEGPPP
jgi:uncharacterized small protein (TIGR04563 family)